MLPLEGIFFIPSLVAVPVALATLLLWKGKGSNYPRVWRTAFVACVGLCLLFFIQVWNTPFYSQRDHSPDNPGGASASVFSVLALLIIETCVVIPAFPLLIVLPWLSPPGWHARSRAILEVACLVFVCVLAALMFQKNAAFITDYQQAKQQGRPQGDQFQHLRRP